MSNKNVKEKADYAEEMDKAGKDNEKISTTSETAEASSDSIKRKHEVVEDEDSLTMLDVLKDSEAMEEDAKAVLGNADDQNCSYHSGGYMKRQPIYACLTCSVPDSDNFKPAALCLACSYHCHINHEIVELYTKRHFRCDCGNDNFSDKCKLANDKTPFNEGNRYNQNFKGLYCTCHRPYPDPEDESPDQMIQCIICEDWYHGRHLQGISSPPSDESYAEMICHLCFEEHKDFLSAYKGLSITKIEVLDNTETDALEVLEESKISSNENGIALNSDSVANEPVDTASNGSAQTPVNGAGSSTKNGASKFEKNGGKSDGCRLKSDVLASEEISALFLPSGWREQLCSCPDCLVLYSKKNLEFLLEPEDTVHHYEAIGLQEGGNQYEEGMKALGTMDRSKQIEAIRGYNEMKEALNEFLRSFAEQGKVVTEADVKQFFAEMKASKKQKVEIPKFCR